MTTEAVRAGRQAMLALHLRAKTATSVVERVVILREYAAMWIQRPKPLKRRKVLRSIWNWRRPPCWACGGAAKKRHHVIPLANGGSNKAYNILPLCVLCERAAHGGNQVGNGPPRAGTVVRDEVSIAPSASEAPSSSS